MPIDIIASYDFIPLSVTSTLAWVRRSTESQISWLHFHTHLSPDQMNFGEVFKKYHLKILILRFRVSESRDISEALLTR